LSIDQCLTLGHIEIVRPLKTGTKKTEYLLWLKHPHWIRFRTDVDCDAISDIFFIIRYFFIFSSKKENTEIYVQDKDTQ